MPSKSNKDTVMKEWKITEGYKVKEDEVSWEEMKGTIRI